MSEWKEYKFAELLVDESISYGVVQPGAPVATGVPIIRVNNIKHGKINADEVLSIAPEIESKYNRTRLRGGELLITVVGSVGECAIVPDELRGWNVARAVSVANIKPQFNKQFVRYSFLLDDVKFQMYGNTNDTVQPTLNLAELKNLRFTIPTIEVQNHIAEILSSLDDKIDLLHRQNKTLEEMAETLFRQWFVDKANDGTISQLVSIQNGYAFKSSDFKAVGRSGIIKIKNIADRIIDIDKTDFISDSVAFNVHKRFKIISGDILIAMTGAEIGKLGIIPRTAKSIWLNQRVGKLKENFAGGKYLAYLQLKSDFGQDYIENAATGSAQPNISSSSIENCGFPTSDESFLLECASRLTSIYEKITFNLGKINDLAKMREVLLPKLMSGEIHVGKLN